MNRIGTAAGYGAMAGLVCAGLVIGLPVALTSTVARDVEWLGNALFIGLPLVLLGALAGVVVAGRRQESRRRRSATVVVAVVAATVVVLSVLAGTTRLFT